ncbi:MAG TPA: BBP7 family outer membrane beta-barrel protein [Urbifossiella sp.]|jgi:hypothetical protein
MFGRRFLGLAALAASGGVASAQPMTSAFGSRPTADLPAIPMALPAVSAMPPVPAKAVPPNRGAQLLTPVAEPMPKKVVAPPAPTVVNPATTVVNPAAPPGFNAPCPVYTFEDDAMEASANRFWASGQWLYWATSGQSLPALATGSPVGTDRSLAGVLGSPNTSTLIGGNRANNDFRNGYMLNAGYWLNDNQTRGIDGNFFFLGNSANNFAAASDGSQIIARPFTNVLTGQPDSELVSFPGVVGGAITARSQNQIIGGGINGLQNICCNPCGGRLDAVVGFTYLNVSDSLQINENLTSLPGQTLVPAGTQFQITDRFATSNNFYGGLVGLSGDRQFGRFFVGGRATVAFGANNQIIDISGSTVVTPPGGPSTTYQGGLLAQPSNIGHYERTVFAVLPALTLRGGVQVTDNVRVFAGYTFMYLSNVVRAGDQIDPRVNTNQPPPATGAGGPALPAFSPKSTDFWAQGISLGLQLNY